jgi:hypothetical protein
MKLVFRLLFLASFPVWAGKNDEATQRIPLNNFQFQPVNNMERSVPRADFEFELRKNCLCAVSVKFKPAKGSAGMWVTDRSWFNKPGHLKKLDQMLSILDGKADVNHLGLNSCNSFFCGEGDPWTSGAFREFEEPSFPSAKGAKVFVMAILLSVWNDSSHH